MTPRTVRPCRAGQVGEAAGVVGRATAAGEPDVDVDEHVADAGRRGRVDGRRRCRRRRSSARRRPGRPMPRRPSRRGGRGRAPRWPAAGRDPARRAAMPTISRGVAQVNVVCPWRAWAAAMAVHLWAFTWGRSRGPGRKPAIVARLCSKRGVVEDERRRGQVVHVHCGPSRFLGSQLEGEEASGGQRDGVGIGADGREGHVAEQLQRAGADVVGQRDGRRLGLAVQVGDAQDRVRCLRDAAADVREHGRVLDRAPG